ncbi:dopaminechrome tautomerase-like [Onthophagus taurus]|uniref:dopaminechrome tautomerase-like n=1 Tax=Onthophagus taurus TaxID=166361 RepID=UPI000C20AA59|nr:protein yellow-like [Onthophagus taurus]
MDRPGSFLCEYFGFIFVSYCAIQNTINLDVDSSNALKFKRNTDRFEVDFEWTYVNFTWPNQDDYKNAVDTGRYIPENNCIAGVKIYNGNIYLALPKLKEGAAVTLGYISQNSRGRKNVLIRPYPTWRMHSGSNCATLQNVQSMEIDSKGVMWILDGNRFNNYTKCPPKLVLLDLENRGKLLHIFEFSEEISSARGGFLNDIVIDETDGGYAYITEASSNDPGLIVYSRSQDKAWKLRDKTMFAEIEASNFTVDGSYNDQLVPIDGIALSPIPVNKKQDRLVYYCALSAVNLYAISTRILKNEKFCRGSMWRKYVRAVGEKQGQSDGLAIDNEGNLYYGLLDSYGIAKWNIYEPINSTKIIEENNSTIIWPDSFSFDNQGFIYVLTNGIHKFFNPTVKHDTTSTKFRLMKLYTGTKSYMYTN